MRRVAALAAVALASACGEAHDTAAEPPTVFAAASLTEVFQRIDSRARFSFAGSGELATQIHEGAPADVYAPASVAYADELYEEGILERPRVFATNTIVVVVPSDNPAGIDSLGDLEAGGAKIVLGAEGVPVGDYARQVLERLGALAVLDNVVSNEQDVKGVLGKVASGDADAGFVYATDARVAGHDVAVVPIPRHAQPVVEYPIAIVADTSDRDAARAFVERVLSPEGRSVLESAGFGVP